MGQDPSNRKDNTFFQHRDLAPRIKKQIAYSLIGSSTNSMISSMLYITPSIS